MLRTTLLALVSLSLLGLPVRSALPSAPPDVGCVGCQGIGGGLGSASNASGGTVSISVAFSEHGECKWVLGTDANSPPTCRSVKGCDPIVTRSWSGLPPNTPLKFTIDFGSHSLWLQNPAVANSGSGTGSNEFDSASMPCDDASVRSFGISCVPCGLTASSEVRCTSCSNF